MTPEARIERSQKTKSTFEDRKVFLLSTTVKAKAKTKPMISKKDDMNSSPKGWSPCLFPRRSMTTDAIVTAMTKATRIYADQESMKDRAIFSTFE